VEDCFGMTILAIRRDLLFRGGRADLKHDVTYADRLGLKRWRWSADPGNLTRLRQVVNIDAVCTGGQTRNIV
jgi:hypothetical protein